MERALASEPTTWPTPDSRDFAALRDPSLYAEVLGVAKAEGMVSRTQLASDAQGLRQRLRRLWLVESPTRTTVDGLVSALCAFGWLKLAQAGSGQYVLTPEGETIAAESADDAKRFRRALAVKLHERYVVPGWLIARLMALNPGGQGLVVLPSPPEGWRPSSRKWEDSRWTDDLAEQATRAVDLARRADPGAFPIDNERWLETVRHTWDKLGARKQRKVSRTSRDHGAAEKPKVKTFAPRGRLRQAMREAAVSLLFANTLPGATEPDFARVRHPIHARSFQAWCPVLDAIELIFYTDSHPSLPGRVLLPCGSFRSAAPSPPFECLREVTDPKGKPLWLYQPTWESAAVGFRKALLDGYGRVSRDVGSLYVSLLDVRDEVCRLLHLSSLRFDELLEGAYRETIRGGLPGFPGVSISLESDIRPEQRSGHGLLRRPVYIDGVPHSLIAIATRTAH